MNEIIKSLNHISNEWLTKIIKTSFNLEEIKVKKYNLKKNWETPVSTVGIIELFYSNNIYNIKLPDSLFIKISKSKLPIKSIDFGKKEVNFYNNIAKELDQDNIIKCYYSVYNKTNNIFNLVFEDLSNSHQNITKYPVPPLINDCYKAIDCVAKIHSAWWNSNKLKTIENLSKRFKNINNIKKWIDKNIDNFIQFLDDRLTKKEKDIIYFCKDNYNLYINRIISNKNLTLTHNDSHFWNFMFPKRDYDYIKLIDWQSYSIGIGSYDLSYMIALHWYPRRRKEYEIKLLKKYHNILKRNGIQNYSFDDLIFDYKLSIFGLIFIPMWQWFNNFDAYIWWSHLERCLLAFDDLNCWDIIKKRTSA